MPWKQPINPLQHIVLSALVAILPILFIFYALIIRRMKGYKAALWSLLLAFILAISVYGMPFQLALGSALYGALYALFPICWIIVAAVYLFNLTVASGRFEVIRHSMGYITNDRRLQALLIAFSFGSFLEGTAGFGTPVAITASMLVALGFNPLYAAGICLIANTAPVAFGSIGIPITVASQISGLPEMAISQMVGRTLPLLSFILPGYLVLLMAGWKKTVEVLPAILVSGGTFAFFQWLTANYLGPLLPDIIAGISSMICLVLFLRFWKPPQTWHFPGEKQVEPRPSGSRYNRITLLKAWLPFILLTLMVLAWGLEPVKLLLNRVGYAQFEFPGIDRQIIPAAAMEPIPQIFRLNYLSAAGTAIFLTALITIPLSGLGFKKALQLFGSTLSSLRYPVLSIAAILAFAYVMNNAGMTLTLATLLIHTGILYPFFAPVLGWLGVFITGSDTSSNALFSKIQAGTAQAIGVDPVVTVGANISGGVVGKMISPQSIALAAAAGNLVGGEAELFRFTLKHSFFLLIIICILSFLQAYIFTWLIPIY